MVSQVLLRGHLAYQPYIEDEGRRIKIQITPARDDGVSGPTYSYVLDKLEIPAPYLVDESL